MHFQKEVIPAMTSRATRTSPLYEVQARNEYEQLLNEKHENVTVFESGLWLNSQWSYMGASPDGIVVCSCHGTGVCEIKCPHCHKDKENVY
ncbi:hypothetical protein QZH41_013388 [Actinostola sp. cb2023]|nr:hypothetical protein QZH41_013388 [Actinostola sp. cb2023]